MVVVFPFFSAMGGTGELMPSLFRFLCVTGILAALAYGAIYALANWADPKPREITVSIPPEKFIKQR